MVTAEIDKAKGEAFGGKMVGILNDAGLAALLSIGHRTGLFDKMAGLRPSTSQQIADAAGLNERYVREWLGGMVAGGIVDYSPADRTYSLPPEHAGPLTRAAGADNVAFFMQYFALIGKVEDEVVESFSKGGGVPYSKYPKFQELQREETSRIYDASLVSAILPLVPGLVERLQKGIDVLDVGCGAGHAVNVMAKAFPNSRFTGYDFSDEGIRLGRAEAGEWGLKNAVFAVQDIAQLSERSRYDLITAFDTIHDQAQPTKVLRNVATALRPDGVFLLQDIAASSNVEDNVTHPLGPLLYTVSVTHCMTVSLAQGGEGLGTVWGEQLTRQKLSDAGFKVTDTRQVPGDILNNYYIAVKR